MDDDRRPILQARARGRRQLLADLERGHAARRAAQLRQDGRVVAGSGADVDDRLAGPRRASVKTARVEAWQTRGDAAFRGEAQHHILVEERGIRRERRLPVFANATGTRADELEPKDLS